MSGRKSRDKGARWERDTADYLASHGWHDCRRELEKRVDVGDIADGPSMFHHECKDHQAINLAGFVDQATLGAVRSRRRWPVVIVKRRQRPVKDAYAVVPMWAFVEIARQLEDQ